MSAFGSEPPVRGAVLVPSMDHLSDVKLHPPSRRASWVDRPRLMEAMAQAVRRPVTLVAAPAGYGKTTVVAQALQGEECPDAAWVSLDAGDNDPVRLWSHVAAALERAGCVLPLVEPSRVFGRRRAGAADPAGDDHGSAGGHAGRPGARPRRLPLRPADRTPRGGRAPRAEPAGEGPRGDHHPVRPRTPAGTAARVPRPGRAPGRGPGLHAGGGGRDWSPARASPSRTTPSPSWSSGPRAGPRPSTSPRSPSPTDRTPTTSCTASAGATGSSGTTSPRRSSAGIRRGCGTSSSTSRCWTGSRLPCATTCWDAVTARRSSTTSSAPTCSWCRSTGIARGSVSTSSSPPSPAASWSCRAPSASRSSTPGPPSGTPPTVSSRRRSRTGSRPEGHRTHPSSSRPTGCGSWTPVRPPLSRGGSTSWVPATALRRPT